MLSEQQLKKRDEYEEKYRYVGSRTGDGINTGRGQDTSGRTSGVRGRVRQNLDNRKHRRGLFAGEHSLRGNP